MAKISTPAVSNHMYRHFAVATLVVTLLVGVFASGENRRGDGAGTRRPGDRRRARRLRGTQVRRAEAGAVRAAADARLQLQLRLQRHLQQRLRHSMDRIGSRDHDRGARTTAGTIDRGGQRYVPASYAARQISEEELAGSPWPSARPCSPRSPMAGAVAGVTERQEQGQSRWWPRRSAARGARNGLE